jgi:predicted nucleotidyltransferase
LNVDPVVLADLERVVAGIDKRRVRCLILFGSQVHNLATPRSDIDLCVVHKEGRWREEDTSALFRHGFMEFQIEPHIYPERLFERVPDLVALDAILSGVALYGHDFLFNDRVSIRSIDKAPILERLDVARSNLESMGLVKGPSKEYFEGMLESMLGELEALVRDGKLVPKRAIMPKRRFEERILAMEAALADGDDVLWVR